MDSFSASFEILISSFVAGLSRIAGLSKSVVPDDVLDENARDLDLASAGTNAVVATKAVTNKIKLKIRAIIDNEAIWGWWVMNDWRWMVGRRL